MRDLFRLTTGEDGTRYAARPGVVLTVLPEGATKLCHQVERRPFATGGEQVRRALRADMDDVKVYLTDAPDGSLRIVVTKQKLGLFS